LYLEYINHRLCFRGEHVCRARAAPVAGYDGAARVVSRLGRLRLALIADHNASIYVLVDGSELSSAGSAGMCNPVLNC
jgi:hypothetical protein